jgi:hypothetical protein
MEATPRDIIQAAELTEEQREAITTARALEWGDDDFSMTSGRVYADCWLFKEDDIESTIMQLHHYMGKTSSQTDWLKTLTESKLWQDLCSTTEKLNAQLPELGDLLSRASRLALTASKCNSRMAPIQRRIHDVMVDVRHLKCRIPTLKELQLLVNL